MKLLLLCPLSCSYICFFLMISTVTSVHPATSSVSQNSDRNETSGIQNGDTRQHETESGAFQEMSSPAPEGTEDSPAVKARHLLIPASTSSDKGILSETLLSNPVAGTGQTQRRRSRWLPSKGANSCISTFAKILLLLNDDIDISDNDNKDHIYSAVHLRLGLLGYVNEVVGELNQSLNTQLAELKDTLTIQLAELNDTLTIQMAELQDKVRDLETRSSQTSGFRESRKVRNFKRVISRPEVGDLRLRGAAGGIPALDSGFLQFFNGSNWGFVCDDNFNDSAVVVVCRQLGFTDGFLANPDQRSIAYFPWMNYFQIVLDDVMCNGEETKLGSCKHRPLWEHNCQLFESVFIFCV